MKRTISLATMFLSMMLLLVACGGSGDKAAPADPLKDLNGSWTMDFEKIMAETPEFKDLPDAEKEMAKQMLAPLKDMKLTFDTDKKTMTASMAGQEQVTEFTIKSQDADTLVLTAAGQDATIKFIDKDTVTMTGAGLPTAGGAQAVTLNRVK